MNTDWTPDERKREADDNWALFKDGADDNWRLTEAIKQAIDLLDEGRPSEASVVLTRAIVPGEGS